MTSKSNENKVDFVRKFSEMRIEKAAHLQLEAFLKGFHTVLPPDFTYFLRSNDLDLMIAGPDY